MTRQAQKESYLSYVGGSRRILEVPFVRAFLDMAEKERGKGILSSRNSLKWVKKHRVLVRGQQPEQPRVRGRLGTGAEEQGRRQRGRLGPHCQGAEGPRQV